ncbi:MAG TPA: hypothetical protein VGC65_03920 [Bacteroidia bacterium]|jgi:hypothetical protein
MKASRSITNKQNKQGRSKKPRPEIRDDIDSRKEREEGYTGDISKKGDRKKKNSKAARKALAKKIKEEQGEEQGE